jgi:hypothetical protein
MGDRLQFIDKVFFTIADNAEQHDASFRQFTKFYLADM